MKSLFIIVAILVALCAGELDYGIMIDAGSSGSRIYLYQWPHREQDTLPLVEPTSINQTVVSVKISVPLSSFAANPANAGKSLDTLINYIKANLIQTKWAATPIYLKATAGMRALNQTDQDAIIANVRQYLKATPFKFEDDFAKVIPGTDEGVFGWITVNYALKLLATQNPTTYGALDMGGASTQITFYPTSTPTQYLFNFSLATNVFPLYTYSYPFGQDQANRLVLAGLLADNKVDSEGNILNPCYLAGYNETYQSGPMLAVGTGVYADCKAAIDKYIVTTDSSCSACGMGSVYQPPITGNYYAFSGFAYTNVFFKLSGNASIAELQAAGQQFCELSWTAAKAQYTTVSFLKQYCFTATYLSEVLLKYGFSQDSRQITTLVSVGSIELTWALGAMIYEADLLPYGGELPGTTTGAMSTTTAAAATTASPIVATTSEGSALLAVPLVMVIALLLDLIL